jgi:hypothetical protein
MRNLAAEFEGVRASARSATAAAPRAVLRESDIAGLPPPVQRHVRRALALTVAAPRSVLREGDLAPLPAPVQRHVRRSGALGRPRPALLQWVFDAEMVRKPGQPGMPGVAEQFDRFDIPQRVFFMRSKMFGLPVAVLHRYEGTHASMTVRVASLFNVVDLHSDELARTETVTLLNDLVFFAPAWFADPRLSWRAGNELRAEITFTNGPHVVHAALLFDDAGDLVNFTSDDRSQLQDDGSFKRFRWSTPMRGYREFDGLRLPSAGEAVWHLPAGDFVYGRFMLRSFSAR